MFPFPHEDYDQAGYESRSLRWLRNHASYLSVGKLMPQLGSIALFMIGVLNNALITLPMFLIAGLILGYFHFDILGHPLRTLAVFSLSFGLCANVLPALIGVRRGFGRVFLPGVERRNLFVAAIGWFILGLLCGTAVLLLAHCVEWYRDYFRDVTFTWPGVASSVVGAGGVLAAWRKVFPKSADKQLDWQTVGFGLLGFGLLVIALVLLVDFVVYGNPFYLLPKSLPFADIPEFYLVLSALFVSGVAIGVRYLVSGRRAYDWDSLVSILLCLSPLICLVITVDREGSTRDLVEKVKKELGELSRPLSALVAREFSIDNGKDQGGFVIPKAYVPILESLRAQAENLNVKYEAMPPIPSENVQNPPLLTDWLKGYYGTAQQFVDAGYELYDVAELDRFRFVQQVARRDRAGLVQLAIEKFNGNPATLKGAAAKRVEKLLDEKGMQEICENEVVSQVVTSFVMGDDRHAHIETITDFNEHLELKLRDQSIDGYIAQLKSTFPNARDQEEFASYIGSEVPDLGVGSRSTSAYPGALPYLATSSEAERNGIVGRGKPNSSQKESSKKRGHDVSLSKQRLVVRQAVLKGCLKSLDQASIELVDSEASVDVNGLDEREIYRAIEQERMRRSLRQRKTLELEILAKEIDVSEGGAALARAARNEIVTRALSSSPGNRQALRVLADLSNPRVPSSGDLTERMKIYVRRPATIFDFDELVTIAMAKFCVPTGETNSLNPANQVVVMVGSGLFGDLEDVKEIRRELSEQSYPIKHRILLLCSSMLFTLAYCFFDFNATSIHGYYRDRLSEAFLMKTKPGVGPEIDVRLSELSQLGSTGPYLLVNTAINLQNSKDLALRSTRSDFFIFSKLYCGGSRTGYVTTNIMEKAYSRVRLNTAVAVSAAAVSPNMGRFTNGFIVMLMTFLNVRLGYWVPNPAALLQNAKTNNRFPEVFRQELLQVVIPRWSTLNSIDETRSGDTRQTSESIDFRETVPRAQYGLVGLAFSGGGIRSASLCLGIAQILNSKGVFRHVDYLSTVSGGGFIGSGIVAAMRLSEDLSSNLDDAVTEQKMNAERAYSVETEEVRHTKPWRLPIFNLIREATSRLDENGPWVNLSDGGHIENLGVIELLRRRCRFIFACDGEADPRYQFNGLATVQRLAKIELGIEIEIDTEEIRPDDQGVSSRHWVIGKIHYPERDEMDREQGYLLYLKASYSGDEALTVREYRASNPDFPHEPTSDQFFDVRQFEAYRVLGAHLARSATNALEETNKGRLDTYEGFSNAFTALAGEGSAAS